MKHPVACGVLMTLICVPAFAYQMALITIDPNHFAPGQNISNATTGAELLVMTVIPNPDPNAPPFPTDVPQYSPSVYAQLVSSGCIIFATPCALGGNLVFGYSGGATPVSVPDLWGSAAHGGACIEEVTASGAWCHHDTALSVRHVLRINFSTPTDQVNAVLGEFDGGANWIQAFDSAGNSLGICAGDPSPANPCATWVLQVGPLAGLVRISRSTPDISFVVVGSIDIDRPIEQVQFDSPVSLQLAGLLISVQGVGPGNSLANKVMFAQASFGVGDIPSTCAQLIGLMNEVNAQTGKSILNLTALKLLSTATAIETALGCSP